MRASQQPRMPYRTLLEQSAFRAIFTSRRKETIRPKASVNSERIALPHSIPRCLSHEDYPFGFFAFSCIGWTVHGNGFPEPGAPSACASLGLVPD